MAGNQGSSRGSGGDERQRGESPRGFAAMDRDQQREIASEGGKAGQRSGHAQEFTSQEAREAGRKGGQASHGGPRGGRGAPPR